ncbi:MAG: helix-turn-helix transcriptional regulator [bacterium]|nr:helix-turn-helix transcriptional regulator [bacterium]
MFDQLLPPLYLQLRIHSGLTKTKLADRLSVSRQTVANYESGSTRPDPDYVRRLIEISGCSQLEVAMRFCELLAELIERPVVILEPQEKEPEEPPTVLESAEQTAHEVRRFIPPAMFRTLANSIHVTHMMEVTLKRQTADLGELAADCLAAAERRVPRREAVPQGATGPPANGPESDNRTVGTLPARSQSKPTTQQLKGSAP